MRKLFNWIINLFKVDYNEILLNGFNYDLSKEDIEYLNKKIEEKFS